MTAFTVAINCGSGMQSIDTAFRYIREDGSDLILAGGAEALSHAPLVLKQSAVEALAALQGAKNTLGKAKAASPRCSHYRRRALGQVWGAIGPVGSRRACSGALRGYGADPHRPGQLREPAVGEER